MPNNANPDIADTHLNAVRGATKTLVDLHMKFDEESINKPLDLDAKPRTLSQRQVQFSEYRRTPALMAMEFDRLTEQYQVPPPKEGDDGPDKFIPRAWIEHIRKGLREAEEE